MTTPKDRSGDPKRKPEIDLPEGVDWTWTAESQEELAKHYSPEGKDKK